MEGSEVVEAFFPQTDLDEGARETGGDTPRVVLVDER